MLSGSLSPALIRPFSSLSSSTQHLPPGVFLGSDHIPSQPNLPSWTDQALSVSSPDSPLPRSSQSPLSAPLPHELACSWAHPPSQARTTLLQTAEVGLALRGLGSSYFSDSFSLPCRGEGSSALSVSPSLAASPPFSNLVLPFL